MDLDQSGTISNTSRSAVVSKFGLVMDLLSGNSSHIGGAQLMHGVAGVGNGSYNNFNLSSGQSNGNGFNLTLRIDSDNLSMQVH